MRTRIAPSPCRCACRRAALPSTIATSPADHPAPSPAGQHVTTLGDQADLSVTVYNSDIALVRDVRNLRLPAGSFDLQFMDIAATVNPATVHFRSLTEPAALGVLEQNYEYDLLEPDKLLRKYVGRDVTLVRTRQDGGTTQAGGSPGAASQLQQRAGVADRQARSSPGCMPITSASRSCPATCTAARR